jgi:hypothetical protein
MSFECPYRSVGEVPLQYVMRLGFGTLQGVRGFEPLPGTQESGHTTIFNLQLGLDAYASESGYDGNMGLR